MRLVQWHRGTAAVLALVLAFSLGLQGSVGAEALTIAAMTNTKTYDVHGDMVLVGNGLLTATSKSLSGYGPEYLFGGVTTAPENEAYAMEFIDVDSNAATFNSSQATFTVPKGAKVVGAKLYWSGDLGKVAGMTGTRCSSTTTSTATVPTTGTAQTQQVSVTVNGKAVNYLPTNYTSDLNNASIPTGTSYFYSANADLLSQFDGVVGNGTPTTMTVGNVWGAAGYNCHVGWAMELVYDYGAYDPSQPVSSVRRKIYQFDGYERKFVKDPATAVSLTGLEPQGTGAKLGVVGYEGDAALSGDYVRYTDTTSPSVSLGENYFISRADGAVPYATFRGTVFHNANVDARTAALPNVKTGDSTLTINLGTTNDSYLLQHLSVAVPMADIAIVKTAGNGEENQAIAPGALPSFLMTVYNSGSAPLKNLSVEDPLSPGCNRTTAQMATILSAAGYTNGQLPEGASVQYTCDGPATSSSFTNTASVKGQTVDGAVLLDKSDVAQVQVANWTLTKAPRPRT